MTETTTTPTGRRGWFVVHTQSGYEDRVHKLLLQKIEAEKMQDRVFSVLIPTEDVIEVNNYPLPEIERMAKGNRRVGLGVMGFAESLVKMGIPFDSPASLEFATKLMRYINDTALAASEGLAAERIEDLLLALGPDHAGPRAETK